MRDQEIEDAFDRLKEERDQFRADAESFRDLRALVNWPVVTEVYISPLIATGAPSRWQVELNYGDRTESFDGDTLPEAVAKAKNRKH